MPESLFNKVVFSLFINFAKKTYRNKCAYFSNKNNRDYFCRMKDIDENSR